MKSTDFLMTHSTIMLVDIKNINSLYTVYTSAFHHKKNYCKSYPSVLPLTSTLSTEENYVSYSYTYIRTIK